MDGKINSGCTPDDTEDKALPCPYYFMDGNINSNATGFDITQYLLPTDREQIKH
jgi:hypothetical protein